MELHQHGPGSTLGSWGAWDEFLQDMSHGGEDTILERLREVPSSCNADSANRWKCWRRKCTVEGWNALHIASIRFGWSDIVRNLLVEPWENGPDFDVLHSRSTDGLTALHVAVIQGKFELVKGLISIYDVISQDGPRSMAWEFSDSQWLTPLHYAVLFCKESEMKELLKWENYNQHVNACDRHRRTALHMAAGLGTVPIRGFIEHSKVDINAVDCCSYTPLHWAIHAGNNEAFRSLLSPPKDKPLLAAVEDDRGKSILQMIDEGAFENGLCNTRRARAYVRQLLLSQCLDVKANVEKLYRDRGVFVQTANAFLVGSALVTGGAINGWLQPPKATSDYHHLLNVFWVANSGAVFFSLATVLAGAMTALPWTDKDAYLGTAVQKIRKLLLITSALFLISIILLLAAFFSLGFIKLDNSYGAFRVGTIVITIIGTAVSIAVAAYFCKYMCVIGRNHFQTRLGSRNHNIGEGIAVWWVKFTSWMKYTSLDLGRRRYRKELKSRSADLHVLRQRLDSAREIYEELIKADEGLDDTVDIESSPNSGANNLINHWSLITKEIGNAVLSAETSNIGNTFDQGKWAWVELEKSLQQANKEEAYRIQMLEDAYHVVRDKFQNLPQSRRHDSLKDKVTSAIQHINKLRPGGIHDWIDKFSVDFCRVHVVMRDLKRYEKILQKIQMCLGTAGAVIDTYTVLTEEIFTILRDPVQKEAGAKDKRKSSDARLLKVEEEALLDLTNADSKSRRLKWIGADSKNNADPKSVGSDFNGDPHLPGTMQRSPAIVQEASPADVEDDVEDGSIQSRLSTSSTKHPFRFPNYSTRSSSKLSTTVEDKIVEVEHVAAPPNRVCEIPGSLHIRTSVDDMRMNRVLSWFRKRKVPIGSSDSVVKEKLSDSNTSIR